MISYWVKVVTTIVIFLLIIKIPFFDLFNFDEKINSLLDTSLQGILIITLATLMIRKMKLENLACLTTRITNLKFYLFPILIIFLGIYNVSKFQFGETSHLTIYIFLLASLLTGLSEEFVFRGIIQSIILKNTSHKKNYITITILSASCLFSITHLINLVKGFSNIESGFNQLIFAFFMGIYLGSLLLITKQLFIVGVLHGLINFIFGFKEILTKSQAVDNNYSNDISQVILNVIVTTIILSPILVIGLYQTFKVNKEGINVKYT